ncbi:unnamed protein product [Caenorhabditis bovis]|nr:unnamed protein product [Caenorhabditis bovis]
MLIHRVQTHGESAMLRCGICSKKYGSKAGIASHYVVEFRMHECQKCLACFRSAADLSDHEANCDGPTTESTTTTPLSSTTFTTTPSTTSAERKFMECDKCKLLTANVDVLTEHLEKCVGELPDIDEIVPKCSDCALQFLTVSDLLFHRNKAHGLEAMLRCHFCDRAFTSKSGIQSHLYTEYGIYPPCTSCGLHFGTISRLESHQSGCMTKFEEALVGVCEICNKGTYNIDFYVDHLERCRRRTHSSDVDIECTTCDEKFMTVMDLVLHKKYNHTEKELLECAKCDKRFATSTGIYWHLNLDYEIYKCKFCGQVEMTEGFLNEHQKNSECSKAKKSKTKANTRADDVGTCAKCGILSYFPQHLEVHSAKCDGSRRPTNPDSKQIKCFDCDDVFLRVSDLLRHIELCHADQTEYQCRFCEDLFDTKDALRSHYIKEFCVWPCPKCKSGFQSEKSRAEHSASCTAEVQLANTSSGELMKCKACRSFTYSTPILKKHEAKCNGEVPFPQKRIECSICRASAISVGDLLTHRNDVHGEAAMLTCGVCDKKFVSKLQLFQHLPSEYNLYGCRKCGAHASTKKHMKAHQWICNGLDEPKVFVSCENCGKLTLQSENLDDHQCGQLDKSKEIRCTMCDKLFMTIGDILHHRNVEHDEKTMLTCPVCQEKFRKRYEIKNHLEHEYRKHNYENCENCGKEFRIVKELQKHMAECKPMIDESINQCSNCGVFVYNMEKFEEHQECCKNYPDDNLIKCLKCQKRFLTVHDLLRHRLAKYGRKEMLKCQICGQIFDLRSKLANHLIIEYGVHQCSKCAQPFSARRKKYKHEAKCDGVRKFPRRSRKTCLKCGRKVSNAKFLFEHEQLCKNDSPAIDCHLCDEKYLTINDLVAHWWKCHPRTEKFQCLICGILSATKHGFVAHLNKEFKIFDCKQCNRNFGCLKRLEEHKVGCY